MPFSDELRPVAVVEHRREWERDFAGLAAQVWDLELADEGDVEHVGSRCQVLPPRT